MKDLLQSGEIVASAELQNTYEIDANRLYVSGLSMGGYGALKSALTRPDRFGMCASLSGSLDITALERIGLLPEWRCIFDHNMQSPKELAGTEHDLFYLADKLKEQGTPFPKTFIWCGTDDWLLDSNNRFSAHLHTLGFAHEYRTSEGNHSWKWWDLHIQDALNSYRRRAKKPSVKGLRQAIKRKGKESK